VLGAAEIRVFQKGFKFLPVPILQTQLKLVGVDLSALFQGPAIGRVYGDVDIAGPLNNLTGSAKVRAPRLTLYGERFQGTMFRVGILRDRLSVYEGTVQRANGGKLSLWGDLHHNGRLAMDAFWVWTGNV